MNPRKSIFPFLIWCALLILLAGIDLLQGIFPISSEADLVILRMVRLPRILTAIIAGGGLAVAGAQMQSILINPLADPHIMGISSGASLGAAIATLAGGYIGLSGGMSVAIASITGAAVASAIIMAASLKFRRATTLLVFGVMLSFIVNALVTVLQSGSDAESLKIFYSWSAGSFSTTTWSDIITLAIAVLIGTALAIAGRKGLDIILFGDEFALMAGAKVGNISLTALLSCCIMTGTVTAFCGPLGFVGITAPHIARWMFGTSSHKVIIPASILTGGIISIAADLISQLSPSPLPTASTMALVGIPVILYILIGKP